jgi:FkbM family methyltransferase
VAVRLLALGSDMASRAELLRLRFARRPPTDPPDTASVRVRALGGRTLILRTGTTDIFAFTDDLVFGSHLPPREIRDSRPLQIVELGTNIGVGLAALAHRYPQARLLGVEASPDNAALARRNVQAWGDRCTVVEAAVWDRDCSVTFEGTEEYGFVVRELSGTSSDGRPVVAGRTFDALLEEHMPEGDIDFVFFSAERSEQRILRAGGSWPARVRAIKVETYPDDAYGPADAIADLARLGFVARNDDSRAGTFAVGLRPDTVEP